MENHIYLQSINHTDQNVPVSPFPWLQNINQILYLSFACIRQKLASCGYQSSLDLGHQDAEPTMRKYETLNYVKNGG